MSFTILAVIRRPPRFCVRNSWKKALSRSNTDMANAQINSHIHLQFLCRPSTRGIWCKPHRRLTASYSLRRRPWPWPCNWWPPFRNDWSLSRYHGRHASRLFLHHWSRICPQLWRLVLLPFPHRVLMGSCAGQCPWIAFRDVFAKDKRACECHVHPHSILRTWPGVSPSSLHLASIAPDSRF